MWILEGAFSLGYTEIEVNLDVLFNHDRSLVTIMHYAYIGNSEGTYRCPSDRHCQKTISAVSNLNITTQKSITLRQKVSSRHKNKAASYYKSTKKQKGDRDHKP